ncbi:lipoprotein, partial [Spiroplasma melliferum]
MKKLLSILGVCGLVGMSANLTACNKPNNNENGGGNKPDKPWIPQQ